MSQENVEIVLRGVAALNRGDPEAFNALCDARFEMRLVGAVGEPVSYVGADGVFQFFRDMGETGQTGDLRSNGHAILIKTC
jgi:ketosteroid isomerase-like protein